MGWNVDEWPFGSVTDCGGTAGVGEESQAARSPTCRRAEVSARRAGKSCAAREPGTGQIIDSVTS